MYTPATLLVLAAASASTLTFAERAAAPLSRRDVAQGWSLQSDSAPDGTRACGDGSYCPSSLYCFDAKNSEVASCCPSDSEDSKGTPCVGEVEGSPSCADASWDMYSGIDGNGFCCEVGKVGVLDRQARTMGCVASDDVGSQSTAVLTVPGNGAAPTSASSSSSASATSTSSSSNSSSTNSSSTSSSASPTGSQPNDANAKGMAMGVVAAGLLLVAAL